MKTMELKEFFDYAGYDWEKDKEKLATICKFTKTRVKPHLTDFKFTLGLEQPFLIKAIAEHIGSKYFFEIGTGRGTACYSTALNEEMAEIMTVDIVPHDEQMKTAINYKPVEVSNADIYEMIPFEEKKKITFKHTRDIDDITFEYSEYFDLCFIDGNHMDAYTIYKDFNICKELTGEGGVILFDDYHPQKFAVKSVVDRILQENSSYDATLIKFHGHLFDEENKAQDHGIMMVTI